MLTKVRNSIGGLALILASFFVAILAAEAALRLFPNLLPEGAAVRLHWARQTGESPPSPHPYIGFLPRPEGFAEGEDASDASAEAIWAQRNLPPWPESAEIVAVGDSFAYSQTVALDQAWTVLLDRLMPASRVITLGTIGSGPQQYLRVFETYGVELSPKLVLYGLFMGNDVYDAELFDRWWHEARNQDYRRFRSEREGHGLRAWIKELSQTSYTAMLVRELIRSRNDDRFLKGETIELESGERVQVVPRFLVQVSQRAADREPSFRLVVDNLSSFNKLVKSKGGSCLVLLFPSKEEVYVQYLEQELPLLSGPIIDELERLGIDYLDLGPIFRKRAREGRALYHEVDGHPNVRGYGLIAEVVSEHLHRNARKYGLSLN
jgi:hypothetical protein